MVLSGALFVLFLAGCWLLCLTDAATTPAAEFPGLSKRGWIAIITVTFIAGAIAWYLTSRRRRLRAWPQMLTSHSTYGNYDGAGVYLGKPMTAEAALAGCLARRAEDPTRAEPVGPDDDPEFLHELSERIRRER